MAKSRDRKSKSSIHFRLDLLDVGPGFGVLLLKSIEAFVKLNSSSCSSNGPKQSLLFFAVSVLILAFCLPRYSNKDIPNIDIISNMLTTMRWHKKWKLFLDSINDSFLTVAHKNKILCNLFIC